MSFCATLLLTIILLIGGVLYTPGNAIITCQVAFIPFKTDTYGQKKGFEALKLTQNALKCQSHKKGAKKAFSGRAERFTIYGNASTTAAKAAGRVNNSGGNETDKPAFNAHSSARDPHIHIFLREEVQQVEGKAQEGGRVRPERRADNAPSKDRPLAVHRQHGLRQGLPPA